MVARGFPAAAPLFSAPFDAFGGRLRPSAAVSDSPAINNIYIVACRHLAGLPSLEPR